MRCGCIIAGGAVLATLMLCSTGCPIALDLVNPDLLVQAGFDPNRAGTVIVMFQNNSSGPATFYAFESVDANDLTKDSRNFSVEVEAGKSRNEVLGCPVGAVSPGILGADFSIDSLAATVVLAGGTGQQSVNYTGAPLTSPRDFSCGDLILITLSDDGTTVTVQVIPS